MKKSIIMEAVTAGLGGKTHRKQRAGPKAEKRKLADKKKKGVSTEKTNPKARSSNATQRNATQRKILFII